eukprot:6174475-Pleurochrysis_carterae.AAC.2
MVIHRYHLDCQLSKRRHPTPRYLHLARYATSAPMRRPRPAEYFCCSRDYFRGRTASHHSFPVTGYRRTASTVTA